MDSEDAASKHCTSSEIPMGEARRAETPAAAFGVTWIPFVRMLVCPWWASCEAVLGVLTGNFEFVLGASWKVLGLS